MDNDTNEVSRRGFLRHLTVVAGAAVALPLAAGAQTPPPAPPVKPAPAKFEPVGKVADFKPGEPTKKVLTNGSSVYITKSADAKKPSFQALSSKCTHKGCEVLWTPADSVYKCPCHQGKFDATGKNVAGPPPSPLPALATKVEKGMLLVQV